MPPARLEAIAHRFDEEVYEEGERVLRKDLKGSGAVRDPPRRGGRADRGDGGDAVRPGEFFGEISLLTGEPPVADIVAPTMLRCLVIPGPEFERFMLENPRILYRMLQEARRLRNTTEWKSGS